MSLFPCHSLRVTLQPLLQPSCLVGISPDLVLASQTPYSKLLRFQNKQQKEGVNLRAAKFAIAFWLSWNWSAILLVRTTTDFQISPHIARFLPCLHPPSFACILCPPRPPFSHRGLSRWCHPVVAAGWKLGRSGSGERRVLRPGAACSASPRGTSGLGEPSPVCFHACAPLAIAWLCLGYGNHIAVFMLHCAPEMACLASC